MGVQRHRRHAGRVFDARLGQPAPVVLHHQADFLEAVHRRVGHEQHAAPLATHVIGGLAAQDGHVDRHRLLHRLHIDPHLANGVVTAFVRDTLSGQQALDQHQVLVEALALDGGIDVVTLEFMLQIAEPTPSDSLPCESWSTRA